MRKKKKTEPLLFKVIETRIVSEHATKKEASEALKNLKPSKGGLGVVIEVGKEEEGDIYD